MQQYLILTVSEEILLGVFMFYVPAMERKGVFFGKRTSETPAIPRMIAQWRWAVFVITLTFLIGSILGGWRAIHPSPSGSRYGLPLWIGSSILQPIALAAAWLIMRYRFEPAEPEPIDMNLRRANLRRSPEPAQKIKHFLALGPLLAILASIAFLALQWGHIPQRFPLHWNLGGHVDGWGHRSVRTLSVLPMIAAGVWAFFIVLLKLDMFAYMSARRRFGFELLLLGLTWTVVLPLCLTNAMLPFANPETIGVILMVHILAPVIMAAICIPLWLKVSSQLSGDPPATPAEINRRDNRYWRYGFYFNPDDPALWVEKRYGVGPTPNMAHPQGKAVVVGFLVLMLALVGWGAIACLFS